MALLSEKKRSLQEEARGLVREHDQLLSELIKEGLAARKDGDDYAADDLKEQADLACRTANMLEALLKEI